MDLPHRRGSGRGRETALRPRVRASEGEVGTVAAAVTLAAAEPPCSEYLQRHQLEAAVAVLSGFLPLHMAVAVDVVGEEGVELLLHFLRRAWRVAVVVSSDYHIDSDNYC